MSRLNSSIQHDLQRSYPINSLVHMTSLPSLAPILSLSDFRTVSVLYTQFSTSQCWNQQLRIRFPIDFNPHPRQSLSTMNQKFEISEILDSKIDNRRHACKPLYLVHWTGYEGTDEETSWILASKLRHASELVADFHSAYPAKSGPLSSF